MHDDPAEDLAATLEDADRLDHADAALYLLRAITAGDPPEVIAGALSAAHVYATLALVEHVEKIRAALLRAEQARAADRRRTR